MKRRMGPRTPFAVVAACAATIACAEVACGAFSAASGSDDAGAGGDLADRVAGDEPPVTLDDAMPTDAAGGEDVDASPAVDAAFGTRSTQYRALVLSHGPYAYWRFASRSGKSEVNSPKTDLAVTAGAPDLDIGIFGPASAAMRFSASTSNALVGTGDFDSLGSGDFTLEAWVNPVSAGATDRWLFRHSVGNPAKAYGLLQRNNTWTAEVFEDGNRTAQSMSVTASAWHHIVAARSAGPEVTLYVDGKIATNALPTSGSAPPAGLFLLGGGSTTANLLAPGTTIAEVAVYKTALGPAKVEQHYMAGK